MLARASLDQIAGVNFAISHARLFRTLGRLPYGPAHKTLMALTWLETWLRWPLRTLNMLDGVSETFSALDPDGQRFGLTEAARADFRKNLLYRQVPDLLVLLTGLERPDFRRRALVIENEDVLTHERERGPGAIVVGFRMGVYPVIPWVLGSLGSPVSMVVGNETLVGQGRGLGQSFLPSSSQRVRFIDARDSLVLARCLDDLNAGGLVCTLLEMSPIKFAKTTDVQFFGWTIHVPYGISYLAAATGRNIVPATLTREEGPRFRLSFGEPLPAPARSRASIRESTQQLYQALERQILRSPEQWVGWTLLSSHMGIELQGAASSRAPTPVTF